MKLQEISQLKRNMKLMFCQNGVELITKTDEGDDVVRQGSGALSEILSIMCLVTVCVWPIIMTCSGENSIKGALVTDLLFLLSHLKWSS